MKKYTEILAEEEARLSSALSTIRSLKSNIYQDYSGKYFRIPEVFRYGICMVEHAWAAEKSDFICLDGIKIKFLNDKDSGQHLIETSDFAVAVKKEYLEEVPKEEVLTLLKEHMDTVIETMKLTV